MPDPLVSKYVVGKLVLIRFLFVILCYLNFSFDLFVTDFTSLFIFKLSRASMATEEAKRLYSYRIA